MPAADGCGARSPEFADTVRTRACKQRTRIISPLYIARGSADFSPSRYAGVGAAGHSSASYFDRAAFISRWMSVRTCTGGERAQQGAGR